MHHGKRRHPDDLGAVIGRAAEVGCRKLIVTGSDLQSSRDALELAAEYREFTPNPPLTTSPSLLLKPPQLTSRSI